MRACPLPPKFESIYPEFGSENYWELHRNSNKAAKGDREATSQELLARLEEQARLVKEKHNYGKGGWANSKDPDTGDQTRFSTERKAQIADKHAIAMAPQSSPDAMKAYDTAFRLGSLAVHPSHGSLVKCLKFTSPNSATISVAQKAPTSPAQLLFGMQFLMMMLELVDAQLSLGASEAVKTADAFIRKLIANNPPRE